MTCADLFILPSEQESFGLVALEAQSCGVPVVSTPAGGVPEVVADGETGFLLPVGDISSMAGKALQILNDSKLAATFQKQARQRAVQYFDSRIIIPRYEKFYQEILNQ